LFFCAVKSGSNPRLRLARKPTGIEQPFPKHPAVSLTKSSARELLRHHGSDSLPEASRNDPHWHVGPKLLIDQTAAPGVAPGYIPSPLWESRLSRRGVLGGQGVEKGPGCFARCLGENDLFGGTPLRSKPCLAISASLHRRTSHRRQNTTVATT